MPNPSMHRTAHSCAVGFPSRYVRRAFRVKSCIVHFIPQSSDSFPCSSRYSLSRVTRLSFLRESNEGLLILCYLSLEEWPRLSSTARFNNPSELARFSSHGRIPPVGLRVAVERGPSQGARSGSTGPTGVSFQSFSSCAFREQ